MSARTAPLLLALVLGLALVGCAPAGETRPEPASTPPEAPGAATGLAPGLYDLEDGSAQALGVLTWVDLEGGFWALVGGTEAEGDAGTTVAVIANGAERDAELRPLEGSMVLVTGERFEGASIRMAGPEIVAETIEKVEQGSGPAE